MLPLVESPEGCMWKFWPEDCEVEWVWLLSSEDSTEGKGSRSGGGGVRVFCNGEALYDSKWVWGPEAVKGGREARLMDCGD